MSFAGKKVWIVGASSGIGEALARRLNEDGAQLLLSARREEELQRIKQECIGRERVEICPVDLCEADSIEKAAQFCREKFDRLDVLVCCAGISQRSMAIETEQHVNRRLMEVNFFGPVAVAKAMLPAMVRSRAGQVVLISSLAGKFGTPMRSGYSASKHALHGYFSSLRAELRSHGVGVTIVCPGYVNTQISLKSLCGDGRHYGVIDEQLRKGMPVDKCAALIAKGILSKKEEIFIGGYERFAVLFHRFFPRLFSKIISRSKVK